MFERIHAHRSYIVLRLRCVPDKEHIHIPAEPERHTRRRRIHFTLPQNHEAPVLTGKSPPPRHSALTLHPDSTTQPRNTDKASCLQFRDPYSCWQRSSSLSQPPTPLAGLPLKCCPQRIKSRAGIVPWWSNNWTDPAFSSFVNKGV